MCGLSGYAGFSESLAVREALVFGLGMGIDDRGGHAAGFVSVNHNARPSIGRKLGYWANAKDDWLSSAASGPVTMMHARYATCGKRTVHEAHPFEIVRNGKTVLWGAHNGVLWDADDSAKAHQRRYDVDSRELFELLADREYDNFRALTGYGVITWIEASDPTSVRLARLTDGGDLVIKRTKCGSLVWGSTDSIVEDALDLADLVSETHYELKTGEVYIIRADATIGHLHTHEPMTLSSWTSRWSGANDDYAFSWENDKTGGHSRVSAYVGDRSTGHYRPSWDNNAGEDDETPSVRELRALVEKYASENPEEDDDAPDTERSDDSDVELTDDDIEDCLDAVERDERGPFDVDDNFATEWARLQWEQEEKANERTRRFNVRERELKEEREQAWADAYNQTLDRDSQGDEYNGNE